MNQPLEPDERVAQRLREAHALLDEQPSATVRSAILLAAARRNKEAPGARTERAGARPPWLRFFAWRPPLAAGAAIFAGVLAITIGLRVEREQGAVAPSSAPFAPGEGGAAPSAPSAKNPSLTPAPATIETGRIMRAPEGDGAVPGSVPVPLGAARPKAAASSATGGSAAEGASEAVQSEMQLAPAPSMPAAPADRSALSGAGAEPGARARRAPETIPNLQHDALTDRQPLPVSALKQAPTASSHAAYTSSPELWLKHIAELRAARRDAEAEQELARFASAYPNLAIPPSAQPR
ncbi:hypothetical protein SBBP1_1010007 [Burkholderiales bacterium]|nr:hypothetical protein SBBP1_1010007 [Burkholderiales bacterium]